MIEPQQTNQKLIKTNLPIAGQANTVANKEQTKKKSERSYLSQYHTLY